MAVFTEPQKWAQTLGKDADVTTIPDTAGDTDPSIDKIFPSVFSIPLAQGGRAIPRSVLNGLFKLLGDWIYYIQNGGIASYSNTFDYAVGSFVKYNNQLYICIQANGLSTTIKNPTDSAYWLAIPTNPLQSDLFFDSNALRIRRNDNDKYLAFIAGNNSATSSNILINGNSSSEGLIYLKAIDANKNANALAIKADGDILWNATNIKSIMANMSMPSIASQTLTVGANGTTYTAPSDGYFSIRASTLSVANGNFIGLENRTRKIFSRCSIVQTGYSLWSFVPCVKNDIVAISYNNVDTPTLFFIPAIGAE